MEPIWSRESLKVEQLSQLWLERKRWKWRRFKGVQCCWLWNWKEGLQTSEGGWPWKDARGRETGFHLEPAEKGNLLPGHLAFRPVALALSLLFSFCHYLYQSFRQKQFRNIKSVLPMSRTHRTEAAPVVTEQTCFSAWVVFRHGLRCRRHSCLCLGGRWGLTIHFGSRCRKKVLRVSEFLSKFSCQLDTNSLKSRKLFHFISKIRQEKSFGICWVSWRGVWKNSWKYS